MEDKKSPTEAFLSECLEYLEGDINDDDKMDFYSACISYMTENNELLSSNLQDCYSGFKDKGDRTLINWINKLVELLESEKYNLWQNRKDSSLTKFPMIKKNLRQSGGAGNKTNYSIVPIDLNNELVAGEPTAIVREANSDVQPNSLAVKYYSRKLEKTLGILNFVLDIYPQIETERYSLCLFCL
ncbi:hypothetical protein ACLKMH_17480 [Psychromonas sp. KJ10-10]|uniref:hypothetical protein n=1 Tax=Psychromonas sp. KJ10-10 TaxID=3391823 RepID=UPI0039B5F51C